MNAILFSKRFLLLLVIIIVCFGGCACRGKGMYEWKADKGAKEEFSFSKEKEKENAAYVLNVSSATIHRSNCRYVAKIKEENRLPISDFQRALAEGYRFCNECLSQETAE